MGVDDAVADLEVDLLEFDDRLEVGQFGIEVGIAGAVEVVAGRGLLRGDRGAVVLVSFSWISDGVLLVCGTGRECGGQVCR